MNGGQIYYRCDTEKNTECRKRSCYKCGGPCRVTKKTDCAVRDADGKMIEEFRVRKRKDGTD